MKLNLDKKIKELRQKYSLTQEQLAEKLNVSTQAVSRWETNTTFPDIELLPDIANTFEISVDELLGINEEENKKKIEKYLKESDSYFKKGDIPRKIEILEEGIKEFPTNLDLQMDLFFALHSLHDENRKETLKRVITLGLKLDEKVKDVEQKCCLYQILAYTYLELGDEEQAKTYAKKLPFVSLTSNYVLTNVLTGVEQQEHIQYNIQNMITNLMLQIQKLCKLDLYSNKEKITILKKLSPLFELVYENKDYGYENYLFIRINCEIASLYALDKDIDNTILYLNKSLDNAIEFDNMSKKFNHTSLLNNKTEFDFSTDFGKDYIQDEVTLLKEIVENSNYEFLKDNDEFKKFISRLNEK